MFYEPFVLRVHPFFFFNEVVGAGEETSAVSPSAIETTRTLFKSVLAAKASYQYDTVQIKVLSIQELCLWPVEAFT